MKTRRLNSDEFFWIFAAFFLPCVILMLSLNKAPDLLFSSITRQVRDISDMKATIARGRIFYSDVLCDILTRRFYPSYIICFLIGGNLGTFLIRLFFYLRFGLLSVGIYLFSSWHVKNSYLWSAILGVACSVSAVGIVASTNPQIMNVMIVMPFAACFADSLMRHDTKYDFWSAVVCFSLFIMGGIYGLLTGPIFMLFIVLFFKGLIGTAKIGSVIKAYCVSLICQLPLITVLAFAGMHFIDIETEFENSRVTFKYFDLLTTMLDGTEITIPQAGFNAVMSVSILVLMLAILFFLNRSIPFKAKACCIVFIIFIPVSSSWSLLSAILSIVGNQGTAEFSRITALCIILFLMAAISLRNIPNLKSTDIYLSVFAVLAFITVANSSSSSEVVRSIFNLWFSGAAVIFWGICFLLFIADKKKAVTVLASLGAIGIAVNTMYCLSISYMTGNISSISPYAGFDASSDINVVSDGSLPLSGETPECINVEGDLREGTEDLQLPEVYNLISREVVLEDIFEPADAFTVFSSGVSELGPGRYCIDIPGQSTEILLRAEALDTESSYYVYSSFGGQAVLTEQYNDGDVQNDFNGPFFKILDRREYSVNLRQVTPSLEQTAYFSLWRANGTSMEALGSHAYPMDRYTATVPGSDNVSTPGYNTVVTSVLYNENYNISVKGPDGSVSCDTFNLAGKLAGVYYSDGISDYSFRISSDNTVAVVSVVIWILCSGFVIYNVVRNKERTGKETANAEQKDNRR